MLLFSFSDIDCWSVWWPLSCRLLVACPARGIPTIGSRLVYAQVKPREPEKRYPFENGYFWKWTMNRAKKLRTTVVFNKRNFAFIKTIYHLFTRTNPIFEICSVNFRWFTAQNHTFYAFKKSDIEKGGDWNSSPVNSVWIFIKKENHNLNYFKILSVVSETETIFCFLYTVKLMSFV